MTVQTRIALQIDALERQAQNVGGSSSRRSFFDFALAMATGTASGQSDTVYYDEITLTAATTSLGLLGPLASKLTGLTANFADVTGILIQNMSTATGEPLIIGGGPNPFVGAWVTTLTIPSGGLNFWLAPTDGASPVAGTGDQLQIDPGAKTITLRVLLLGRSV